MEQNRASWQKIAIVVTSLALALAARSAQASVSFKAESGWELSFDGFVNAFAVDEIGSTPPAGVAADVLMPSVDVNRFRVRTGLLPGLFAFNVAAPKVDDLEVKARVGFYPQIQNANTRNAFGAQIDLREIYFTVDGPFGQFLLGRALNLYQGKNILTDMTLFGVGAQGGAGGGGTTLGRIGLGYVYANFGAQLRYTTPDVSGLKLAVAAVDPSVIGTAGGISATTTKVPGVEGELSFATKVDPASVQLWVSGLYQRAWIPASATAGEQGKTAAGGAAGVGVTVAAIDVLASGFLGKGIGSFFMLDTDSLDLAGEEREGKGFLAQAALHVGPTKLGVSYGQNTMDETAAELAARQGGANSTLETRRSFTGGVYHDLTKSFKLVAEYTHMTDDWFGGQSQSVDVLALGGFFLW